MLPLMKANVQRFLDLIGSYIYNNEFMKNELC